MPIIDTEEMTEYQFVGRFYETRTADETLPLIEQEDVTELVLETPCDVQQASILGNAGFKTTTYNVYFPVPCDGECESDSHPDGCLIYGRDGKNFLVPIRRGMDFRCDCWGYSVDGVVEGVGFSLLGGVVAQIKDRTE